MVGTGCSDDHLYKPGRSGDGRQAPYPAFGPLTWRGDVGNSTFEGLQFTARRAFQSGFSFTANYMWSHSINDGSIGEGESDSGYLLQSLRQRQQR
jgi:hypothetical protein